MGADVSIVLPVRDRAMPALRLIDHLVRVCPEQPAFDVVLVVGPDVDAVDRDRLRALGGDVTVVESTSPAYGAGVLTGAAHTSAPTVLLVDLDARPDRRSVVAALAAAPALVAGVAALPSAAVADHADVLAGLRDFAAAAPFLAHARRTPPATPGPDLAAPASPDVPVVLVARGDAAGLADRLAALRDTGTRPRLVTVVDAGLTPAAVAAAARFGAHVTTPPAAGALSAYVEDVAARADAGWVAIVDGDVTVSRFWLAGLVGAVTGDPRAAVAAATANRGPAGQRVEGVDYGDPRGFRAFADGVRRRHAGRSEVTTDVGGGCLLVSVDAVRRAAGTLERRAAARCWSPADLLRRLTLLGYHARVAGHVYVDHAFDGSCAGPLLTATLIVKDEQAMLPGCLHSVRDVVDEVVVIDTGSADATVAIARRMGARLGGFPWCDDFAAARNAALERCSGPWALWIDADERAECPSPQALREQLALGRGDAPGALWVTINSFHGTRAADAEVRGLPAHRLFRADLVTFTGRVHERPVALPGARVREAVVADFALAHLGYLDQVSEDRHKADRNLQLATLRADEEGGWLAQYELGRASLKSGHLEEGIAALDAALTGRETASTHALLGLQLMGNAYLELGRYEEAAVTAARGLSHNAGHPGLVLVRTAALEARGRVGEALTASSAELDPTLAAAASTDVCTLRCLRGGLLILSGDQPAAADLLQRTAREFPTLFEPWPVLVRVLRSLHPGSWPEQVLACAGPDSFRLFEALPGLAAADRERLAAATAHLLTTWVQRLVDRGDVAKAGPAVASLEPVRPDLALALWRALPGAASHVGELRCLTALHRLDEAAGVLAGIDADGLGAEDALFAATLAVHAGAGARAAELLAAAERRGAVPALLAEVRRAAAVLRPAS